jgi:hypothetical protein
MLEGVSNGVELELTLSLLGSAFWRESLSLDLR